MAHVIVAGIRGESWCPLLVLVISGFAGVGEGDKMLVIAIVYPSIGPSRSFRRKDGCSHGEGRIVRWSRDNRWLVVRHTCVAVLSLATVFDLLL